MTELEKAFDKWFYLTPDKCDNMFGHWDYNKHPYYYCKEVINFTLKPEHMKLTHEVKALIKALEYYASMGGGNDFLIEAEAYDRGVRFHTVAEQALEEWER